MDRTVLSVENVTLELGGERILDDLSIDFWQGHVHALVGPNGAGKSTLANVIMGLSGYTDHQGTIRFRGRSLAGLSVDERARLGITKAWQEPARYEGLTVRNFIRAGARDKRNARVDDVLQKVGLSPAAYRGRAVDHTLSGGERKRIELASILAMEPEVVLMDEPDSGIDVEALDRIFEAIRYFREAGTTVILITHSVQVLEQAEHAFLLCCGQLQGKGSVDKVRGFFARACVPCEHPNLPETERVQNQLPEEGLTA